MVASLAIALFLLVFLGVVAHEVGSLLLARRKMQRADEYADAVPFIIPGPPEDVVPPEGPFFAERPVFHDVAVPLQLSHEPERAQTRQLPPIPAAPHVVPSYAMAFDAGATMVFARPSSHPLPPARLEVISGVELGDDIQLGGDSSDRPRITLGREMADEHGIVLASPTVSRRHADITFADGHWNIANLSHTNPVVVNDHPVTSQTGSVPLEDGDLIELGEVVLQFHAQ